MLEKRLYTYNAVPDETRDAMRTVAIPYNSALELEAVRHCILSEGESRELPVWRHPKLFVGDAGLVGVRLHEGFGTGSYAERVLQTGEGLVVPPDVEQCVQAVYGDARLLLRPLRERSE